MQLSDLLALLRDDFAAELPSATEHALSWAADPANGRDHAKQLRGFLQRSAQAAEMIGLQGFSGFLGQMDAFVNIRRAEGVLARPESLQWLGSWVVPAMAYLDAPAEPASVDGVLTYLRACPEPTDDAALLVLGASLAVAPSLPDDMMDEAAVALEPATAADVGLDTSEIDGELFAAFLNDAPQQVERLGHFGQKLAKEGLSANELTEAQRIAHTFKGSGNIIGLPGIGKMAHRVEDVFDYAIERAREGEHIPPSMARDTATAVDCMAQMVGYLQGEDAEPRHAQSMLQRMLDWVTAIHSGEPEDFKPEPVSQSLVEAPQMDQPAESNDTTTESETGRLDVALPTQTGTAQAEVAGATVKAPLPSAGGTDQMRMGAERLTRLMRRAGQSLVFADRYAQLTRSTVERLNMLEVTHSELMTRLRELELSVDRQVVALTEKKDAGAGFDALEMDRYSSLHTMTRAISESVQDEIELARQAKKEAERSLTMLRDHNQQLRDQHRELIDARLVPVKSIVPRLKRNILQTAATTAKQARLEVIGDAVTMDSDVLQRLTEPLLHLLRNAVDHGLESPQERQYLKKPPEGVVTLTFERVGQEVRLTCADDGRGLNLMAIFEKAVAFGLIEPNTDMPDEELARLILRAGFSTRDAVTEVSGRGVGLDVVADRVNALNGRIDIRYEAGSGTQFILHIPVSSGSVQGMVVRCEGEAVALSANQVIAGVAGSQGEVLSDMAGAAVFQQGGQSYPLFSLSQWLGFGDAVAGDLLYAKPKVLVRGISGTLALAVDEIVEARELILQELGLLLRRMPGVVAVSLRADGNPLFLLDVPSLERSSKRVGTGLGASLAMRKRLAVQRVAVLVVDDALSVRKSMQQLLEDAGFEAITAVDGVDAIDKLRLRKPAVMLTDLEMPNLNGMELTRRVREVPDWLDLPVVMITSRATEKHRNLAFEVGVNVYLTKPYTDLELLNHVRKLSARSDQTATAG